MALWSSGVTWSSGTVWGPSSPTTPPVRNTHRKRTSMKRNDYYPNALPERPEWHQNFAAKLLIYGPTLTLTTSQVNNGVADNLILAYGLGEWISNVREFAPACTASLTDLATGTGGDPFVFIAYNAPPLPTLPVGITAVLPGALDRTFALVKVIKGMPGYTEAIGIDLGIVGAEATTDALHPTFTLKAEGAGSGGCNCVKIRHVRYGHYAVAVYSKRGTGDFELLGISAEAVFMDERPLLVPGQPEIRQYKERFWDAGTENGDWSDIGSITVSP